MTTTLDKLSIGVNRRRQELNRRQEQCRWAGGMGGEGPACVVS